MISPLPPRLLAAGCLAVGVASVLADPAFAQSTGSTGGNVGTLHPEHHQPAEQQRHPGPGDHRHHRHRHAGRRTSDLRRAGTVIIGIIVIFGAATIVDLITGASRGSWRVTVARA